MSSKGGGEAPGARIGGESQFGLDKRSFLRGDRSRAGKARSLVNCCDIGRKLSRHGVSGVGIRRGR
jgi:hypothetical protein